MLLLVVYDVVLKGLEYYYNELKIIHFLGEIWQFMLGIYMRIHSKIQLLCLNLNCLKTINSLKRML